MRRVVLFVVISCAASGPTPVPVAVGRWRVAYRDWAGVEVCQTEPSWLLDEVTEVNAFLDDFTRSSSARGGTWADDEVPVLEEAVARMRPLLESHSRTLAAVGRCPYATGGSWASELARGRELVTAARAELDGAPQFIAFVRHRVAVEQWRKGLEARRVAALEACRADAGFEPRVAFAWGDELEGTTWLFCDGAVVRAPLTGGLELSRSPESWPAARLKDLKARCFELARVHPEGLIEKPPR